MGLHHYLHDFNTYFVGSETTALILKNYKVLFSGMAAEPSLNSEVSLLDELGMILTYQLFSQT